MADIIEFNIEKRQQKAQDHVRRNQRILATTKEAVEAVLESLDGRAISREDALDLAVLTHSIAELFEMVADELDHRG